MDNVMDIQNPCQDFISRLKLLIKKRPDLMSTTLSNIFTMRSLGNKTHGDLAEVGIAEFINQYMYDFSSVHVGKDLYRAKSQEEDIEITNEISKLKFNVSLKAYGHGPLQLATDKNSLMFTRLEKETELPIQGDKLQSILEKSIFSEFQSRNVLPLIYDESNQRCNILIFKYQEALEKTASIWKEEPSEEANKKGRGKNGRKHPVYRFYDLEEKYICEVRYGNARANALQRGLWTNTKNATDYFDSITDGWIQYSHNLTLVRLFSHALVSSESGHILDTSINPRSAVAGGQPPSLVLQNIGILAMRF